jgi:hypothetical protein
MAFFLGGDFSMRIRATIVLLLSAMVAALVPLQPAMALDVEHYTVYCADDRIEISFWDLEQMKVRRGSDVCQFASYTSYSSAIDFADDNFGGEGSDCSC